MAITGVRRVGSPTLDSSQCRMLIACDKRDGHRQTFTGAASYCRPTGFWQSVDAIYAWENHQSCDCYTIVCSV